MKIYCDKIDCKEKLTTHGALIFGVPTTAPSGASVAVKLHLCPRHYNQLLLWISDLATLEPKLE